MSDEWQIRRRSGHGRDADKHVPRLPLIRQEKPGLYP